jgi:hypothetical protein
MGKKKKTLDFSNENIRFKIKEQKFKVLSLNLNSMDIEVIEYEETRKKVTKMPFAQLPKDIKKLLRPL